MLSVSQPLRSVGILLLSPVLRALHNTRIPRSVPCSNAVPSDIQHYGNSHLNRSQTNGNQTNRTPDLLGIFILYFRARFFLEAPFAEVLSGLLWTAYWPLVFLFSPFFGVVLARSFFPIFRLWIPKRCKGVHCVDLGESFPTVFTCKIWLRYSRERADLILISLVSLQLFNFDRALASPVERPAS